MNSAHDDHFDLISTNCCLSRSWQEAKEVKDRRGGETGACWEMDKTTSHKSAEDRKKRESPRCDGSGDINTPSSSSLSHPFFSFWTEWCCEIFLKKKKSRLCLSKSRFDQTKFKGSKSWLEEDVDSIERWRNEDGLLIPLGRRHGALVCYWWVLTGA